MMSMDKKIRLTSYLHNGFCFRLKKGTYLMMACYVVPDDRRYMIRVIGDGVKLELLE